MIVAADAPAPCPLCNRPNLSPSDHHLIPKSRGGTHLNNNKIRICRDCHKACHILFSNRELERQYNSVDALLGHPEMAKMIRFIRKQDPGGKVRFPNVKRFGGGKARPGHPW